MFPRLSLLVGSLKPLELSLMAGSAGVSAFQRVPRLTSFSREGESIRNWTLLLPIFFFEYKSNGERKVQVRILFPFLEHDVNLGAILNGNTPAETATELS